MRRQVITLLLVSLFSASAGADNKEARARALFKEGDLHYRMAEFQQALAKYKLAYKLHRHPAIIFNLAQCNRQLKRYEKALFYYKLYLSDWRKKNPNPPNLKEVEGHIKRLQELIKPGPVKPKPGDKTPRPVKTPEPEMKPPAPEKKPPMTPTPTAPGTVRLEGVPEDATVQVDGVAQGAGPEASTLSLPPGAHKIVVQARGYAWERTLEVAPGKEHRVTVALVQDEVPARRSTLWLAAGISTAALAAGSLAMGIAGNVAHNNAKPDSDEWATTGNVGVAGYVLAGSFAVLSGVSWFIYWRSGRTEQNSPSSASRVPLLVVVPGPHGVLLSGAMSF